MDLLSISITIFIIMESANVAILYFWPGSRLGKGYSKALGWMITGFLIMFILALIGHILVGGIGV